MQDSADIFNGFGSGRRIISTGSICTPENVGAGENGSFVTDPVPCIVRSDNVLKAGEEVSRETLISSLLVCDTDSDL